MFGRTCSDATDEVREGERERDTERDLDGELDTRLGLRREAGREMFGGLTTAERGWDLGRKTERGLVVGRSVKVHLLTSLRSLRVRTPFTWAALLL